VDIPPSPPQKKKFLYEGRERGGDMYKEKTQKVGLFLIQKVGFVL
jgi:hypothetical protein